MAHACVRMHMRCKRSMLRRRRRWWRRMRRQPSCSQHQAQHAVERATAHCTKRKSPLFTSLACVHARALAEPAAHEVCTLGRMESAGGIQRPLL
jgi:hypothetical protein